MQRSCWRVSQWTLDDEVLPGGKVTYTLVADVPDYAAGLTWKFSDGETGAAFDLSTFLQRSVATEGEALVALYNATDGPNWGNNTNWLSDAPLDDWFGVVTDAEGRVVSLILRGNGLSGKMPPELGNLSSLEGLLLDSNQLSGSIPSELGSLWTLEDIYLYS